MWKQSTLWTFCLSQVDEYIKYVETNERFTDEMQSSFSLIVELTDSAVLDSVRDLFSGDDVDDQYVIFD